MADPKTIETPPPEEPDELAVLIERVNGLELLIVRLIDKLELTHMLTNNEKI